MTLQGCPDERVTTPCPPSPPPIPLQTYLWEDVRRERKKGGYPWTHFVKRPFDPDAPQEILEYDRSPGSKRKYGSLDVQELEESPSVTRRRRAASAGESLGNETRLNGDTKHRSKSVSIEEQIPSTSNASPKSILKNRPKKIELPAALKRGADRDSPKDSECCHPFVDKLKTIADKNILKSPRAMKKLLRPSPKNSKKHADPLQEIVTLDESPSAERRKRETEKIFEKCSPKRKDSKKFKDHIYESIEDLPNKSLTESVSEKELNAIAKSLSEAEDIGRVTDDLIARDSLTRSLDQYLKEELMSAEDQAMIDSKNEILQDILKRIADENQAQAPLSKMDSEEEEKAKLVKQMPIPEKDEEMENLDGDKCLVIDITETVEEEIVDFIVMPDEDQDIGELSEKGEVFDSGKGEEEKKKVSQDKESLSDSGEKDELLDAKSRRSKFSDHEYESIGDPDSEAGPKPTSAESNQNQIEHETSSSVPFQEPSHLDEHIESDRELTVAEMQQQIEDKYFKKVDDTLVMPTTQADAPEMLEEDEAKAPTRTVGERSRDMQRRFKNQAGKLKTKFKGMKKPTFTMPARKKPRISDETTTESSDQPKPKLSPMRKLTMPDFKMPDRPKISMPDFKMPERPKISMPQFKMPDKSRFKMPERPHMPDFKMPDRPKMPDFKMPDFKMPEMPDFKLPNLKRHNSMKEPPTSSESTAEDPKKRIVFDFKTYPRIFTKKQRDQEYHTSSPKEERVIESSTVPRAAARKKGPVGARWVNRFTDIKFVDDGDTKRGDFEDRLHRLDEDYKQMQQEQEFDDIHPDSFNESSEDYSGHQNRYWADEVDSTRPEFNYGVKVDGQETPSSNMEERGSSGESYEKRRVGVLEEIDADEFFLRQRGISQDDIEVGKYLSSEIRDAFKTPVNALEQVGSYNGYEERDLDMNDYSASRDVDEGEDLDMEVSLTPLKPERTRSLRRQKPHTEDINRDEEVFNGFNTFPPNKPRRQKKGKKYLEDNERPVYNVDKEFNDENDRNVLNRDNINNFESLLYENQMMEGKTQPDIMVVHDVLLNDINRRMYENDDFEIGDNAYENEENIKNLLMEQQGPPPRAPRRKRKRSLRDVSASSEPGSIINAQFQDDWPSLSQLPADIDDEVIVHRVQHEYIIPLAESEQFPSPTPPRRTRSRSLTSRATTAPDEDRTSHGAESLVSDNDKDLSRNILDLQDASGYAVVKRTPSVPKRRKRFSKSAETRPSYHSTPRMKEPPPRPPPRRQSVPDLRADSLDATQYEEVEDDKLMIEDLNSGDVLNKMKDRPLPAPPRPPRAAKRKKKPKQDNFDGIDSISPLQKEPEHELGSIDNLEDELLHRRMIQDIANRMVNDVIENAEMQVEQAGIDEHEMWTQTDPLPDCFVCEDDGIQPDEVILKDVWKDKIALQDINNFSTIERNKDDSRTHKEDSSRSSLDPSDVERARKIADSDSLTRGLRRFRESSRQRTFSSSRTPSERAMSEHALLLERTLVTPTKAEDTDLLMTEAKLLVQPVDDELDIDDLLEEKAREEKRKQMHLQTAEEEAVAQIPNIKDICLQETEAICELEIVDEPPVPMKRRASLKKSRSIPTQETEPEQKLSASAEVDIALIRRQQDVPVASAPTSDVEILKTNRLQVSNLDVENLNVSQLQANSIKVSEVDGVAMQVKELNSKSGNLVVTGIDIAPTIIQEIIGRLTPTNMHNTAQISTQTDEPYESSKKQPESVQEHLGFPPTAIQIDPSLYFNQNPYMQQSLYYPHPGSVPPASFYTLRPPDFSEEEVQQVQLPKQTRRRHAPKKESTSEEEQQETVTRHRRMGTRSPEPSIQEITGQLVQACSNSVQRNARQIWNAIKTKTNTEERKREIQIALIVLLVFTAGLIMIALSDNKTVHHHHWEFFNPPTSDKNA